MCVLPNGVHHRLQSNIRRYIIVGENEFCISISLNEFVEKKILHASRKIDISDQDNFTQRIMNRDFRFANTSAFIFAAVAYIEAKQIRRNMGISFKIGTARRDDNGDVIYSLSDPYSVLENVKNTPKYWQKARYELIARLENLGPFTFFFTLSCADLRWPENFSALLKDVVVSYDATNDEITFQKNLKLIQFSLLC